MMWSLYSEKECLVGHLLLLAIVSAPEPERHPAAKSIQHHGPPCRISPCRCVEVAAAIHRATTAAIPPKSQLETLSLLITLLLPSPHRHHHCAAAVTTPLPSPLWCRHLIAATVGLGSGHKFVISGGSTMSLHSRRPPRSRTLTVVLVSLIRSGVCNADPCYLF
ncbi:hypothetical protein DEO72_LG5g1201 [Vigna unguiculata]|uniref:Uncharacterized protein n=1 Tax=Vigna unguiculata TaxID=3917 RepID=A0A4D6LXC0_VIGUN|nr:hypothetical protein DEO72_LG5g1201 [Vigna unguiculata]